MVDFSKLNFKDSSSSDDAEEKNVGKSAGSDSGASAHSQESDGGEQVSSAGVASGRDVVSPVSGAGDTRTDNTEENAPAKFKLNFKNSSSGREASGNGARVSGSTSAQPNRGTNPFANQSGSSRSNSGASGGQSLTANGNIDSSGESARRAVEVERRRVEQESQAKRAEVERAKEQRQREQRESELSRIENERHAQVERENRETALAAAREAERVKELAVRETQRKAEADRKRFQEAERQRREAAQAEVDTSFEMDFLGDDEEYDTVDGYDYDDTDWGDDEAVSMSDLYGDDDSGHSDNTHSSDGYSSVPGVEYDPALDDMFAEDGEVEQESEEDAAPFMGLDDDSFVSTSNEDTPIAEGVALADENGLVDVSVGGVRAGASGVEEDVSSGGVGDTEEDYSVYAQQEVYVPSDFGIDNTTFFSDGVVGNSDEDDAPFEGDVVAPVSVSAEERARVAADRKQRRDALAARVTEQSSRNEMDSMSSVDSVVTQAERDLASAATELQGESAANSPAFDGSTTGFESDFFTKNVDEVAVNARGRTKLDESVNARSADGTVAKRAGKNGKKQRYRYIREDGRMNGAELEFFKNLQTSKGKMKSGGRDELEAALRAPANGIESEKDRRKRALLITQTMGDGEMLKRGSRLKFDAKDADTLRFLVMFRYATAAHLSNMFQLAESTMYNRLKRLRTQGLVIDKKIFGSKPVWYVTDAGMLLSGMDLARTTDSKINYSMLPHQFTVNSTASHLWGANLNVLNLDDYPSKNRMSAKGVRVFGEELVSELEIQTVLGRKRGFDTAEIFRPQLENMIENMFEDWEEAGGVSFGQSPEMLPGNEFMWSLFPPKYLRRSFHVPDLVVKRDRNLDGTPESIAVEIEISNKNVDSYRKTLESYMADERIFKKVIWVCKSRGTAQKLETVARDVGLLQAGRISIVPIYTENGVFTGRNLWEV